MKVAVLGSSGGMGAYFVRRFLGDGHTVIGYDARKARAPRKLMWADSNAHATRGADVVLISVPIRETGKIGREIASSLKEGSVLVEITSLKAGARADLNRALRGRKVTLISVHPMFGPLSTSRCPRILVLGGARELDISRSVFPWARLIQISERDHDKIMAYALNLVHLLNLAFVSTVSKGIGIEKFGKVSSPLGAAQLAVSEAVLSQDPSLYSYIMIENPFAAKTISSIIREFQKLAKVVREKDQEEFERRFVTLSREIPEPRLRKALEVIYTSFD